MNSYLVTLLLALCSHEYVKGDVDKLCVVSIAERDPSSAKELSALYDKYTVCRMRSYEFGSDIVSATKLFDCMRGKVKK